MQLLLAAGLAGQGKFQWLHRFRAKKLNRKLLHYLSAAVIPTNADECLEAVESNLTGHSAIFLIGMCDGYYHIHLFFGHVGP